MNDRRVTIVIEKPTPQVVVIDPYQIDSENRILRMLDYKPGEGMIIDETLGIEPHTSIVRFKVEIDSKRDLIYTLRRDGKEPLSYYYVHQPEWLIYTPAEEKIIVAPLQVKLLGQCDEFSRESVVELALPIAYWWSRPVALPSEIVRELFR